MIQLKTPLRKFYATNYLQIQQYLAIHSNTENIQEEVANYFNQQELEELKHKKYQQWKVPTKTISSNFSGRITVMYPQHAAYVPKHKQSCVRIWIDGLNVEPTYFKELTEGLSEHDNFFMPERMEGFTTYHKIMNWGAQFL